MRAFPHRTSTALALAGVALTVGTSIIVLGGARLAAAHQREISLGASAAGTTASTLSRTCYAARPARTAPRSAPGRANSWR
ncbi:MAG: hypothetical protein QOH97_4995 [Actinoplanes sp.]|jgi:hypothetical protein|nr:hypothetical protein [Actinoplanes sp.]